MKIKQFKFRYFGLAAWLLAFSIIIAGCGGGAKSASPKAANTGEANNTQAPAQKKEGSITIGTSSAGSSSNAQGIAFAKMLSDDLGYSAKATSIGGADAVVKNLTEGRVQVGVTGTPALVTAYNGKPPYTAKQEVRVLLASQRAEPRQLVVRAGSGINSPKDLEGKKIIGKRAALQDIEVFLNAIIDVYKLDKSKIQIVETTDTNETTRALKQGTVDAAFIPGDLRTGPLVELSENTSVKLISFPDDQLQQIIKKMDMGFSTAVIPKGTYKGTDVDVKTIGFQQTLTVMASLPDDTAYNIVKSILGDEDRFNKLVAGGKDWFPKDNPYVPVDGIPMHPGAIKYYKEKGWLK